MKNENVMDLSKLGKKREISCDLVNNSPTHFSLHIRASMDPALQPMEILNAVEFTLIQMQQLSAQQIVEKALEENKNGPENNPASIPGH